MIPYHISENNDFKELKSIQLALVPSIISHHINGNIFTVTSYNKEKEKLTIIDINTTDGSFNLHQEINSPNATSLFRLDNRTVIINKKNKSLFIKEINSCSSRKSYKIDIPKEKLKLYKLITKEGPRAVNQNEYVEKGAISTRKVYLSGTILTFTYDNLIINTTDVMSIDYFKNDSIEIKSFDFSNLDEINDYNTFIENNKLYTVSSSKKDLVINIIDLETEIIEKSFSLIENLKDIYSDSESFLKNVKKARIRPTLTVNKTKNENLLLRIDQVDHTTYQYNYNWWFQEWWFHQQMIEQMETQQRLMNNVPSGFGPSPEIEIDFYYFNNLVNEIVPIEFVVNQKFEIIKNATKETKYKNIKKDKYLEPFSENKKYKNFSACFSNTEMRYIYLDKKSKKVHFKTVKI